jgi:hypothetical protein
MKVQKNIISFLNNDLTLYISLEDAVRLVFEKVGPEKARRIDFAVRKSSP